MKLSDLNNLRRILNSPLDAFNTLPKPDKWKSREKLARFTAWQYGSERDTVKGAYRKLNKVLHYMSMQRQDEVRLAHHYSEERVRIGVQEHNMDYSNFKNSLNKAHILLDNTVLSQLAIYEPQTFKNIALLAKKMCVAQDKKMLVVGDELEQIELTNDLFREPVPLSKVYPRSAVDNHTNKPRKLREEEY
uniref:DNA helicase n=1 Tax=Rhabditophanes sp. KR3021 TaxID=114890 RepID=A0AC35UEN0_9BILA